MYFWKGNSIKILEKYEKLIYWEDKNWLKPKINLKVFFFIVLPVNTWISSSLWRWSFGHCWWWWWSSLNIRILHIILYSRAQHEIDSRFVGKKKRSSKREIKTSNLFGHKSPPIELCIVFMYLCCVYAVHIIYCYYLIQWCNASSVTTQRQIPWMEEENSKFQ